MLVITFFMTKDLQGTICDDFISIHIDGGARTALDWIHDELIMPLAAY